MEDILDVGEKELLMTVSNYGRDPMKQITNDETMLLARTIYTLHKKYNYTFDEIMCLLPPSRMSGSYTVEIQKLLGELYTGTIGEERHERIPKNFVDLVNIVQERNDCSKAEAMKHLWKSIAGSPEQIRVRHIESISDLGMQKQQSAKEQSVDTGNIWFLALEKAMKGGMVYKLQRDILSIRVPHGPDEIKYTELAEELVKKGWMSLRE